MIDYLQVALRAWRDNGDAVERKDFKRAIPLDLSDYACEGFGEAERAVLVVGCEVAAKAFKDGATYERFLTRLQKQLVKFSASLSKIPAANVRKFKETGVCLDLVASFSCEDGDLELTFPPQFLIAVGNLGLPLVVGPIEKDYS